MEPQVRDLNPEAWRTLFRPVGKSPGPGLVVFALAPGSLTHWNVSCICGTFLTKFMQIQPPYVSWAAFLRTLDAFGGLPLDPVDIRSMAGLSISLASQMTQAFRFLGLITADGKATPEFKLLVEHPPSRGAVLPRVFRQSYPELFGQNEGLLSQEAVEELTARTGLSPATQRKAVTFVLNAAAFMKLPIAMKPAKGVALTPTIRQESTGASTSSKKKLTVELASGGTLEIGIDVDLLRLDRADRDFIFDLIDKVRAYQDDRKRDQDRDVESLIDGGTMLRGDEEVPF